MTHIDERTLERLLNHKMSQGDIDVVLSHAVECRSCGHRLEEWRDHFEEIATIIPETNQAAMGQMVLPTAFVLVPDNPSPKTHFELTNLLWVAAVALALVVGYSASRLQRHSTDGFGTSSMATLEPLGESPRDPAAPSDSAPVVTERPIATVDSVASPAVATRPETQRPAPAPARDDTTPAAPASLGASRPRDVSVTMPGFRRSALGEASQRLAGGIRFLTNLTPDHVEIGPGSAVPGAQGQLDVVRVVYVNPDGSRILLDQQRIPVDESGFRPINDAALENGDTLIGSSAQGVSVATWVDDDGYRMSLAVHAGPDSLRRMVRRVH